MTPSRPFFLASATKLFVTSILAQLRAEARIDWDAPLSGYLPGLDLAGLVVVRGVERSGSMTVLAAPLDAVPVDGAHRRRDRVTARCPPGSPL